MACAGAARWSACHARRCKNWTGLCLPSVHCRPTSHAKLDVRLSIRGVGSTLYASQVSCTAAAMPCYQRGPGRLPPVAPPRAPPHQPLAPRNLPSSFAPMCRCAACDMALQLICKAPRLLPLKRALHMHAALVMRGGSAEPQNRHILLVWMHSSTKMEHCCHYRWPEFRCNHHVGSQHQIKYLYIPGEGNQPPLPFRQTTRMLKWWQASQT